MTDDNYTLDDYVDDLRSISAQAGDDRAEVRLCVQPNDVLQEDEEAAARIVIERVSADAFGGEHRQEVLNELFLGVPSTVERVLANPCELGDRLHRGAGESLVGDDRPGCVEDRPITSGVARAAPSHRSLLG